MRTDPETERELLSVLDGFRSLVSGKDPAVLNEFIDDPDVVLMGSDVGELARGHDELERFFGRIFAGPATYSWDWPEVNFCRSGDVAWFLTDGEVIIQREDSEERKPYRISGVLAKRDGRWLWLQFHGSEPVHLNP